MTWSRRQLTEPAYERAPRPTWTVVVGTEELVSRYGLSRPCCASCAKPAGT
ncbi:DUF6177 family protein [Streptomyces sp. IMTB 1903]|uniref:DUF6177 family protein n=1 Tax=Streptomyces sp. IMTB 1903 TaxID=1776680 RepID=UPI002D218E4A|nr:DUF6177 family protein [Streptomyces sp. IMTB 1903]